MVQKSSIDVEARLFHARMQGLALNKIHKNLPQKYPGCWIWGEPALPPEIEWPGYYSEQGCLPMDFIAQLQLSQLPRLMDFPELPRFGMLYFFTFLHDSILGGCPSESKIIYVENETEVSMRRQLESTYKSVQSLLTRKPVRHFIEFEIISSYLPVPESSQEFAQIALEQSSVAKKKADMCYLFAGDNGQPDCTDMLQFFSIDIGRFSAAQKLKFCMPLNKFKNKDFSSSVAALEF